MSSKQPEPKFELQQVTNPPTLANVGPMSPFSPGRPQNRSETWIQDEWRRHIAIMQAKTIESELAIKEVSYLQLQSASVYKQTAEYIIDIKDSGDQGGAQPYVDAFCKLTLEDLGTQLRGINQVASANISYTTHRDHYPPDKEFEQRGILATLFGL